jgi:hypothetical protein
LKGSGTTRLISFTTFRFCLLPSCTIHVKTQKVPSICRALAHIHILLIPEVQLGARVSAALKEDQTAVCIGFDNLKTATSTTGEVATVVTLLGDMDIFLELLAACKIQPEFLWV